MANLAKDFDIYERQAGIGSNINRKNILCSRLLKLHPNDPDVYLAWGLQLVKQRKYQKAKHKFERSISISPYRYVFYSEWLEALYNERQFKEVIMILENHPEKFSIPANVYNTMGICFLQLGEYENAIKCFEKVGLEKKDYEMMYFYWAVALYLQGKEEARQVFENRGVKEIFDLHITVFEREISLLEEDLKREDWMKFEDLIKMKIKGFEYVLRLMKEYTEEDEEEEV